MYVGWKALPVVNTVGGIILMWDKQVLERIDPHIGEYSVSWHWRSLEDGFVWAGSRVYGPNLDSLCSNFWEELMWLRSHWSSPWCLFGDFNVVRYPRSDWVALVSLRP